MDTNPQILDWHLNSSAGYSLAQIIQMMGIIPEFIYADDPRPAWEQINERYIGGWNAMLPGKWRLDQSGYLHYPGDPVLPAIAAAQLRDELIFIYPHAFVCIIQRDGGFSVARLG